MNIVTVIGRNFLYSAIIFSGFIGVISCKRCILHIRAITLKKAMDVDI